MQIQDTSKKENSILVQALRSDPTDSVQPSHLEHHDQSVCATALTSSPSWSSSCTRPDVTSETGNRSSESAAILARSFKTPGMRGWKVCPPRPPSTHQVTERKTKDAGSGYGRRAIRWDSFIPVPWSRWNVCLGRKFWLRWIFSRSDISSAARSEFINSITGKSDKHTQ